MAAIARDQNTSILSLNDDCFLEIFTHFNWKDLCSMKDCCQRFNNLADSEALRRFRKYTQVRLPLPGKSKKYHFHSSAMVLMKFGQLITHLKIDNGHGFVDFCQQHRDGQNVRSILETCTSLKCLQLYNDAVLENVPLVIFGNIQTLELNVFICHFEKLEAILGASKMLKHFTLSAKFNFPSDFEVYSIIIKYGKDYEARCHRD